MEFASNVGADVETACSAMREIIGIHKRAPVGIHEVAFTRHAVRVSVRGKHADDPIPPAEAIDAVRREIAGIVRAVRPCGHAASDFCGRKVARIEEAVCDRCGGPYIAPRVQAPQAEPVVERYADLHAILARFHEVPLPPDAGAVVIIARGDAWTIGSRGLRGDGVVNILRSTAARLAQTKAPAASGTLN